MAATPAVPARIRHHRPGHAVARTRSIARSARAARFTLLALRREMLHDFLVETGTEAPAFTDAQIVDAGDGIWIGPAIVTVDFIGTPIIRARVRNGEQRTRQVVVTATVHARNKAGAGTDASAIIERLGPGESRVVELIVGSALVPNAVTWKVMIL
jgi:hypothetical protein